MTSTKLHPNRTRRQDEQVRLQGVALVLAGVPRAQVAEQLGVKVRAIKRWMHTLRAEGPNGLLRKPRISTSRLQAQRLPEFINLLAAGPRHYGFPGTEWSAKAIADLARITYDVHLHPGTITKNLHDKGIPWRSVAALEALDKSLQEAGDLVRA